MGEGDAAFPQPREAQAFLGSFVAQRDSMRDVGRARSHGAEVWARHKDKLKSSWAE